jgi:hypothetical protein
MGSWSDTSSDAKAKVARRTSSNYRVRFRHGVYPNAEGQATRADIKKYDYFFSSGQPWVHTPANSKVLSCLSSVFVADVNRS